MRSKNVNELIRRIKKQECRKQGKESQARCDIAPAEYEQVIELTEADINQPNRYLYSAFFRFQVHLIARVDDVSKIFVADLRPHLRFHFALVTKLCWSKNVMDERDCPNQIILGAKDRRYCVLLGLAIHLETWIASGAGAECSFVFGIRGNENTNATKDNVANYLKSIFNNPQFVKHSEGKLGTHSLRKFAATYACSSGATQSEAEARGRWKRSTRIVDTYTNPQIPTTDAKVAAILCRGGPCKYVLRPGCAISEDWIVDYVVPNIHRRFPHAMAVVLGTALLWAVFDASSNVYLPAEMITCVRTAYKHIPT